MKTIKLTLLVCCAAILLILSSCRKDTMNPVSNGNADFKKLDAVNAAAVSPSQFKVIGYFPSWEGSVSAIQFSKLTHINYSFLIPTSSGGYNPIDNASKLSSMVSLAHASGVKAMISVGGGGGGDGFAGIVGSSSNHTTFVNNMLSFCSQNNLDGVDIDWEYPAEGTQASNFATLMQQLGTALHNQGKLLSIAVIGERYDNSILTSIYNYVDYVNIMAYDDNNFQHSTFEVGALCLTSWLNSGLPAAKAILGVPFYGHDSSKDPNDPADQVNYNTILANGANPNLDVYNSYGYDGLITIKSKTSYAMANGGGMCIWELAGDATGANSLLSAINTVRNAGGVLSTGAPVGSTITLKGFNAKYVSGENGTQAMTCTRATAGDWEKFTIVDAGYGKVALRSMSKYVSSEDGTKAITCNRTSAGTWEIFDWIPTGTNQVFLRSTNGLFISSENGTQAMTCSRSSGSGWEAFGINQ